MSTTPSHGSAIDGAGAPEWMILLDSAGLVSADVLQTALHENKNDVQAAGKWLVDHGCVSQRDLTVVQAESYGMAFLEPGDFRANLENRSVVSEELARAHGAFPLFVMDGIITLVVSQPLDLPVLDQIRLHTGCEVDQCLSGPRDVRHLIEWAYGGFEEQTGKKSAEALAWEEILKDVADAPAVKLVNVLLDQAAASQASDVHVDGEEQTLRVRFRIDGVLREVPAPPKELLPAIVSRIKVLAHMDIAETRRPQDGHFKLAVDGQELDIRVSTLPSTNGEALVLRLLRSAGQLLSLEALGMDRETQTLFDRLIRLPHGMVLVTGPTGSGKTTTLYSGLSRIDRVRQSIVTLEDPVEIRLPQIRQVAVNSKAGLTFHAGLRSILRQDPDVIMVGEIRDRETAEIALQAALTGHLLLSTLHTNSAAAVPARMLDMGVADFLVSSALVGVLAQRLCRRLCRHCAAPAEDPAALLELLPAQAADYLQNSTLMQARGCKRCGHTGYDGRLGIFELMVVNDKMRRAIPAGVPEQELVTMARENGMHLLLEDGLSKVDRGLTTVQELLRVAGRIDLGDDASATFAKPRSTRAVSPTGAAANLVGGGPNDFDVGAYEQLLRRWLRPGVNRGQPAEDGRVCLCAAPGAEN